jgi:hypothetical protein
MDAQPHPAGARDMSAWPSPRAEATHSARTRSHVRATALYGVAADTAGTGGADALRCTLIVPGGALATADMPENIRAKDRDDGVQQAERGERAWRRIGGPRRTGDETTVTHMQASTASRRSSR